MSIYLLPSENRISFELLSLLKTVFSDNQTHMGVMYDPHTVTNKQLSRNDRHVAQGQL